MRHVAAYLLAVMGESEPSAEAIKNILGSVGVEADEKQLTIVMEKFAGKDIDALIAEGGALLSSMPAGGMAAGGGAPAGAAAGGAAAPAAEEKKEEKKEEPEEESDDDMGFGLFD
ncbi:60S acidic ribosomal protein P2 [Halocaridina rubra]|uniref:Large ribosomal subunit protein P2 n=1 Tax=Halocaridina rubra TaxID=373956 RepID=A0AAN9AES0_HALRR